MSQPTRPLGSPRRSHSALMSPVPPLSANARSRAESSASSSDSSWTIQTPQSPSIMAVLDLGRKRAGSSPFLGHGHEEPFENSLPHPQSIDAASGSIFDHDQDEMEPYTSRQPFPIISSIYTMETMNQEPQLVRPNGQSRSEAQIPSIEHQRLPAGDLRDVANDFKPSTQPVSRIKRAVPSTYPPDGGPADQSDDAGGMQGRRLRPRLRAILSAPLASSRDSSKGSLAKIAGALSSQKPSIDSDLHTAVNQSTAGLHARQNSQPTVNAANSGSRATPYDEDTIWIQTKTHPFPTASAKATKSPIPASRSIPPTLRRGITSPTPAVPQVSNTVIVKDVPQKPRLDHFERVLPRELKVMIMSKLLERGASEERDRRWSGVVGARRNLIRLSRVSKSWRRLCFDGQLWANVDLTPFAAYLHPRTIRHILDQTAPFISHLSIGRMSATSSGDILSALANSGSPFAMANLTTLDLRCSKLENRAIIAIIQNAPRLRSINLTGVKSVDLETLQHLAKCSRELNSLDLSGCRDVYINDVRSYIETLDEKAAAGFKALRLNGCHYRNGGRSEADFTLNPFFDRLHNLEELSLQNCPILHSSALIRACEALHNQSRTSTIRHLNLSRCMFLEADIFPAMSGLFPELRYLELAATWRSLHENSQSDRTAFNRFLETLPKLEKLDTEGLHGTCIDDSTLKILARAPNLTELNIGFATNVTPGAMISLVRECPKLRVLKADNTQANGAVIGEFHHRHPEDGNLSLIDCRAISAVDYLRVAGVSRPRDGFTGYSAIPMGYSPSDIQEKAVIKAFWSWRRVEIARGWKETLAAKERELAQAGTEAGTAGGQKGGRLGRGKGWRRKDESYDAKGLCVVQ